MSILILLLAAPRRAIARLIDWHMPALIKGPWVSIRNRKYWTVRLQSLHMVPTCMRREGHLPPPRNVFCALNVDKKSPWRSINTLFLQRVSFWGRRPDGELPSGRPPHLSTSGRMHAGAHESGISNTRKCSGMISRTDDSCDSTSCRGSACATRHRGGCQMAFVSRKTVGGPARLSSGGPTSARSSTLPLAERAERGVVRVQAIWPRCLQCTVPVDDSDVASIPWRGTRLPQRPASLVGPALLRLRAPSSKTRVNWVSDSHRHCLRRRLR